MDCILQNSTDKQQRRGVAPSPEPECTERSAASFRHDSTSIQATTVNLQMRLLSQDKIRRRQSKKYKDRDLQDHEILGAVCWRPEDPEFLVKVMCSPECPTRLFNVLYILCIFHI